MRIKRKARFNNDVDEASVNLTPLLDVVFNVLIMFIVVAPMLQIDEVQLAKSTRSSLQNVQETMKNRAVSIQVKKDNTIWVDTKQMDIHSLQQYLLQAKKIHPHAKPLLLHDRNATFGTYQTVKDTIEQAGYEELDVLLAPQ